MSLLLGYGLDQPSFRHRMRSLVEPLQEAGWQVRTEQFPGGRYGLRTWERRELFRWAHVTVLHQIKLSSIEARLFAAYSRRRVFDVDDAIYVRKPRRFLGGSAPDESAWRKAKICRDLPLGRRWSPRRQRRACRRRARLGSREVAVLPTSIDTAGYRIPTDGGTCRSSDDRVDQAVPRI